jgi:ankyrin repeat protein
MAQKTRGSGLSKGFRKAKELLRKLKPERMMLSKEGKARLDLRLISYVGRAWRSVEEVRKLVKKGANVNAKDSNGDTPLLRFLGGCGASDDIEIMEFMISKGADVNASHGKYGWTPLMIASEYSHIGPINLLLDNGADINARDLSGETALIHAAFRGSADAASLLIGNGAEITATDLYSVWDHVRREGQSLRSAGCRRAAEMMTVQFFFKGMSATERDSFMSDFHKCVGQ